MTTQHLTLNRRSVLQYSAIFGLGTFVAVLSTDNVSVTPLAGAASSPKVDATATRTAELRELNELRTQVAEPRVCTPAATATEIPPTATATEVPLAPTGVPLPYNDIWTVTVLGIAPIFAGNDTQPSGQFMQMNMAISHSSRSSEEFPYSDLVLIDDSGRFSQVNQTVSRAIFGNSWLFSIGPGATESRGMIFDVPKDAGTTFILESNSDPTFRVAVTVEQRG